MLFRVQQAPLRSRVSNKTNYLGFMISSSTDLAPSAQDPLQVGRYNRVRDRSQDETDFWVTWHV